MTANACKLPYVGTLTKPKQNEAMRGGGEKDQGKLVEKLLNVNALLLIES